MLHEFSLIFVADTKISFRYDFAAPLTLKDMLQQFKVSLKAPFSDILCHVDDTNLTFSESQLTGFSMMRVFTERCLRADFHFSLNANVNVTVISYMNSTSLETILHNFLQEWI